MTNAVTLEDIVAEFENGNKERLNELWDVFSTAIDAERGEVVDSLLDDLGDGKDVKPCPKTWSSRAFLRSKSLRRAPAVLHFSEAEPFDTSFAEPVACGRV